MKLSHAYLAVRDLEITEDHPGIGGPVVPGSWTIIRQGSTGWWTGRTGDGSEWVAYVINELDGRVLVVACGDQARLEEIAAARDDVMPAPEALRLAYDHGGGPIDSTTTLGGAQSATARRMLRACRWWRCDVIEGGEAKLGVVRELAVRGVLLPNLNTSPLPWYLDASGVEVPEASAARTVTRLIAPALGITFSSKRIHSVFENEADRG